MTISTSWTVSIGTKGSFTDFSSRTAGLSIEQRLERGALGYGNAEITLRNNDGELTPTAGGTYDSVDWFSQLVRISATVTDGTSSETVPVFTGTIDVFDIFDDGVTSNVQILCKDFLAVSGRSRTPDFSSWSSTFTTTAEGAFNLTYLGYPGAGLPGVELASFGGTDPRVVSSSINFGSFGGYRIPVETATVAETVNNSILPVEICHAWPTEIQFAGEPGASYDPDYQVFFSSEDLNRTRTGGFPTPPPKVSPITFEFVENPTGTQLTTNRIRTGYNADQMRNYADFQGSYSGATKQNASSSSSISKYGESAVAFLVAATDSDAKTLEAATRWANRFDDIGYGVDRITLKASTVSGQCADPAYESFADLLDIRSGLWNVATVEYTPTGASSALTDVCVLYGRTINATPLDTTITCELVPASNYQTFQLDSNTLGVLDTNRLG